MILWSSKSSSMTPSRTQRSGSVLPNSTNSSPPGKSQSGFALHPKNRLTTNKFENPLASRPGPTNSRADASAPVRRGVRTEITDIDHLKPHTSEDRRKDENPYWRELWESASRRRRPEIRGSLHADWHLRLSARSTSYCSNRSSISAAMETPRYTLGVPGAG